MSEQTPLEPTAVYPGPSSDVLIDGEQLDRALAARFKQFLMVSGIVSAVIGLLILIWPGHTARVVTVLLAIGVLLSAISNLAIAFTAGIPRLARIFAAVVGVLFAWAGIWALFHLGSATKGIAFLVGLFVGIAWIIDGVQALLTAGDAPSKAWAIFFGLVSIVAGVVLLIGPITGATIIWLVLGAMLLIMGILQVIRAVRFGKAVKRVSATG